MSEISDSSTILYHRLLGYKKSFDSFKDWIISEDAMKQYSDLVSACRKRDTAFVNAKTMESKKVPGLYFAGEILDVDGACGGYNLQWAWSSGYLAGYHAANDQKGQVEQNA